MDNQVDERALQVRQALYFCTGTENYYTNQHISYEYTDGVKIFCEKAGAYWLLDLVESVIKTKPELNNDLIGITLTVKEGNKARIAFRKRVRLIYYQHIPFTDCPRGKWKFYYQGKVLFWNMEY
ncbi:MAG: hypothetical protein IKS41_06025 [Alphaproteobacteria bacterium]|nr:hypothetical protein [Alphaproteobacteria bacterium]